jgi:hypothetical protein
VSRLSRKYGNLDVSQSYRPPRPVTGIALFFLPSYMQSTGIYENKVLEFITQTSMEINLLAENITLTDY